MVERVEHAVARLGQHPAMGRTGRVPLTRKLMVARTPFIVVYRVRETVEVLRVLHAAQVWPPR
jgi:toxin ParE1/3/4